MTLKQISVVLWVLLHRPKLLAKLCYLARGVLLAGREERLWLMVDQFSQQELRYLKEMQQ